MFYIGLYLIAIVLANIIIAIKGPSAAIPVALGLVSLDLTSRDHLHDQWRRQGLVWKMGLLIAFGSILSWVLNRNAGPVALASFVAFAGAGICDALIYAFLGNKAKLLRINGSNTVSAAADSIIFPTLAFGGLMPWVTIGQFGAKVLGGFIWSLILSIPLRKWLRKVWAPASRHYK